jgi:hypothetical protein
MGRKYSPVIEIKEIKKKSAPMFLHLSARGEDHGSSRVQGGWF